MQFHSQNTSRLMTQDSKWQSFLHKVNILSHNHTFQLLMLKLQDSSLWAQQFQVRLNHGQELIHLSQFNLSIQMITNLSSLMEENTPTKLLLLHQVSIIKMPTLRDLLKCANLMKWKTSSVMFLTIRRESTGTSTMDGTIQMEI